MGSNYTNCSIVNVSCNQYTDDLKSTYEYRHVCRNCNWDTQVIHLHGSYYSGIIPVPSPLACFSQM